MSPEQHSISHANAERLSELDRKIEKVVQLLEGEGVDAPGVVSRLALIERVIFGKEHQEGLVYKVSILWRMHVWVLCTMSGAAGFSLREVVRLIWKV